MKQFCNPFKPAELARLAELVLAQPLHVTHRPRPDWHFAPELIAEVEQRKEKVGTYR